MQCVNWVEYNNIRYSVHGVFIIDIDRDLLPVFGRVNFVYISETNDIYFEYSDSEYVTNNFE